MVKLLTVVFFFALVIYVVLTLVRGLRLAGRVEEARRSYREGRSVGEKDITDRARIIEEKPSGDR